MTTATRTAPANTPAAVLFMACELRENTWKLGCSIGQGQKPRARMLPARDQQRLLDEIAHATARFGLPAPAPGVRCDEAGRAGFGRPRFLQAQGLTPHVGDSSSSEVHRRQRRAQSEALDVRTLWSMLRRDHAGARHVWRVVNVPSVAAAAQRPLPRDLEPLQPARASTTTRSKGVLRSQGGRRARVNKVPEPLAPLRLGDGSPLPRGRRRRVLRGYAHDECLGQQIAAWEADRRALRRSAPAAHSEQGRQLMPRKGLGLKGAGLVVMAFFGWRALKTRREVGGLAG
jgi:hypothetical protein